MNKSFILILAIIMASFTVSSQIYVPNAFTPDNDGYNDVFIPISTDTLDVYNLQIYNVSGELVFHTTNIENGWTGDIEHHTPAEIYQYKITYKQHNNVEGKVIYGYVKLLK